MPETCIQGKVRDGKVIGGVFGSLALALGYHFGLPGKTRTVLSAFVFLSMFKCSKCTPLPKYGCGVGLELRVTLDHLTHFLMSIWRLVVLLSRTIRSWHPAVSVIYFSFADYDITEPTPRSQPKPQALCPGLSSLL